MTTAPANLQSNRKRPPWINWRLFTPAGVGLGLVYFGYILQVKGVAEDLVAQGVVMWAVMGALLGYVGYWVAVLAHVVVEAQRNRVKVEFETTDELEAWAKEQPLLPKYFGLSLHCGVAQPHICHAMYDQLARLEEIVVQGPTIAMFLMSVAGIACGVGAGFWAYSSPLEPHWAVIPILAIVCAPVGFGFGWTTAASMKYARAWCYTLVLIYGHGYSERPTDIIETLTPQVVWANRPWYFQGSAIEGMKGRWVLLRTDQVQSEALVDYTMRNIYELEAASISDLMSGLQSYDDQPPRGWTGSNAREMRLMDKKAQRKGELEGVRQRKVGGQTARAVSYTMIIVAMLGASMCSSMNGFEKPTEIVDQNIGRILD
ncbi:MAG: hypothetical protein OXF79_22410 [Chloroflexi bacterium]|nr:hypothetical protein [Chloroflexota bacterium]